MPKWSEYCEKRAERVNALLAEAQALGVTTTRRQGRKALSGRGGLMRKLIEARANQQPQG